MIVLWARCIGAWGQEGFLFTAFRFVCCDAKTRSLLNKKSVEHKSQYSPPGAGASLSSGSGTPGVPSEAFPAALFALAAEWLTKGWISSWLLRVSLCNSGPVGDVSGSHKAEGYCSFEFWHASPLSFGWSRKKTWWFIRSPLHHFDGDRNELSVLLARTKSRKGLRLHCTPKHRLRKMSWIYAQVVLSQMRSKL